MPELEEAARIRLIVHDDTRCGNKTSKSLERARSKFPYLASAGADTTDPDYTIELSVQYRERDASINELAALSLFVIPMISTQEVSARAVVADAGGTRLGEVQSTGRSKLVVQMHLLWVLPIAAPLAHHVDRKLWNNTFRDVFIQAGELIAKHQSDSTGTEVAARGILERDLATVSAP